MNDISPQQALHNLYLAARLAPLKADEHETIAKSAKILDALVNPNSPEKEVKEGKK